MSGWSGGSANRSWRRDARGADSGRIGLIDDIRQILAKWRTKHNWHPGAEWDPSTGTYMAPTMPSEFSSLTDD